MSSLRGSLTEPDWIGRVNLLFNSESYTDKVLFIVEGKSDVSVFRSVFEHENTYFDSPCNGKIDVINSVVRLRGLGKEKTYGICDADFDYINNITYPNVFFTDHHDIEMMMISSGFVKRFFLEFTDCNIYRYGDSNGIIEMIETSIYSACYEIGLLKWINASSSLGFNFNGHDFDNYISLNGFEVVIDISLYIDSVLTKSRSSLEKDDIINLHKEYKDRCIEKQHICNGHDFISLLSYLYKKNTPNNKQLSANSVENCLRMFYRKEHFMCSNLFGSLMQLLNSYTLAA